MKPLNNNNLTPQKIMTQKLAIDHEIESYQRKHKSGKYLKYITWTKIIDKGKKTHVNRAKDIGFWRYEIIKRTPTLIYYSKDIASMWGTEDGEVIEITPGDDFFTIDNVQYKHTKST